MLNPFKLSYKNLKLWTWHRDHHYLDEMQGWAWYAHFILCNLFEYRDIEKAEPSGDRLSFPTYNVSLYLRRFYLVRHGKDKTFLHHILRSDNDRHMHDHPWDFTTRILISGYEEKMLSGMYRDMRTFDTASNKAEHTHKVFLYRDEYGQEVPAWTLIRLTEARRVWGFHTETGWVPWYEYLNEDPDVDVYEEDTIKSKDSVVCQDKETVS